MPEWTGTVVATSEFGIKVVDKGEWLNWSIEEYRGEPFDTNIRQGDRVRIEYAKGKGDKTYISVVENLSRPQESPAPGSVFPPEEDFPPDDGLPLVPRAQPPTATSASVEPDVVYGQEVWAKDTLRARTDCIACATGIFKSCLEAGILKEFPSASAVVAYAVELEKWAKDE